MPRLADAWRRYWFSPGNALDLGVCRFVTCAFFVHHYAPRDLTAWGAVPPIFWMPTPIFRALALPHASQPSLELLQTVWIASLVTAALGLLTRASTALAFALGFYLIGLGHCFGKVDHNDTVVPLLLLVLAGSRCGDAFSLDAWRRRGCASADGAYTWPVRTVWMLTAFVFGAAGLSKLIDGGLAWVTSDNMRNMLLLHHYPGHSPRSGIGLVIAEHAWLYKPMAAAGLSAECLAPAVTFSRLARRTVAPALFFMLLAFWWTHGFSPRPFYPLFAWFVPWGALWQRAAARIPGAARS